MGIGPKGFRQCLQRDCSYCWTILYASMLIGTKMLVVIYRLQTLWLLSRVGLRP